MMQLDDIVQFARAQRDEGYVDGCISIHSFMRGWVSNSPNLNDKQKTHVLAGLDEAMKNMLERQEVADDDES